MIVRTKRVVADSLTPIAAYASLRVPGASCLLESVEHGGRLSRYSFFGLDYLAERTFDASAHIIDDIRAFVAPYRVAGGAPCGGAVVAFAYDAARPFARLPPAPSSVPGMPAAYVAIPATWLTFDHFTHELTVWSCGTDAARVDARIAAYLERLACATAGFASPVRATSALQATLPRERYLELVEQVQEAIADGEVYQLQLGIRFSAAFTDDPFDLYRALRTRNPSPYMFYLEAPFGAILGASPEFLVRLDGRRAQLRPLAGTRPRGASEEEDAAVARGLLADEKERAEHVMLVDLGRNDLGSVCENGSVQVRELLQIERYSHVMHIVSDLSGTLSPERDALDLFAAAFPAGTVTGTPKVRAMQLIDRLEPQPRGFYAGSVGRWSFDGDFDSCITLRSVHVQNGRAFWQASAGIVADSDAESEYREVWHKTGIVREALGLSG